MTTKWVLIDETNGATTGDGSKLDPATLIRIAAACDAQMNNEFKEEYGGDYEVRAGSGPQDIRSGEQVYSFVPTLAQAPGASAYHDEDGNGVPVAFCAVTTCGSLLGPTGISVDASHELLEAGADPSCNLMADNLQGLLVAYEVGDPVEIQTYPSHVDGGVQLSNFVLRSWFNPKGQAPFDFMTSANYHGAVAPPGPLQIAPGNGGNYEITESSSENQQDTFGIHGKQRKERRDTGSRFMRRVMARQYSRNGKLRISGTIDLRPKAVDVARPGDQPETAVEVPRARKPAFTSQVERKSARPARSLSVSQQRVAEMETNGGARPAPSMSPQALSAAGVQAAQRFQTRAEVRSEGRTPKGQIDQQQKVLQGRKQLRK